MKLSEFKAWFEGFTEAMEGAPSEAAWERIKARVEEIDGTPISYPVYIDRYVTPHRPYWDRIWYSGNFGPVTSDGNSAFSTSLMNAKAEGRIQAEIDPGWNSHAAMFAAGKAEALAAA